VAGWLATRRAPTVAASIATGAGPAGIWQRGAQARQVAGSAPPIPAGRPTWRR